MKTFARVLMAVLMAINSVAGGSSALVACVGIDGLHIEFSSQHSCAGHCEKSSPDEVTLEADPHRHCEDFVFTSPLFKDFSDTRQLVQTPEIPCTDAPFHIGTANLFVVEECRLLSNIPLAPPPIAPQNHLPLVI